MHLLEIDAASWELERALGLAEARAGEHAQAAERLQRLIARQCELGVRGLHLGASYEVRTRVAVLAGDAAEVAEYAQLTAAEYRLGLGSLLGARYQRLRDEARRAGIELRA